MGIRGFTGERMLLTRWRMVLLQVLVRTKPDALGTKTRFFASPGREARANLNPSDEISNQFRVVDQWCGILD